MKKINFTKYQLIFFSFVMNSLAFGQILQIDKSSLNQSQLIKSEKRLVEDENCFRDFIYMKNGKLQMNNKPFTVRGINYLVTLKYDDQQGYFIGPYKNTYDNSNPNNYWYPLLVPAQAGAQPISGFISPYTINAEPYAYTDRPANVGCLHRQDCKNDLETDFIKIKNLGFNTLRIPYPEVKPRKIPNQGYADSLITSYLKLNYSSSSNPNYKILEGEELFAEHWNNQGLDVGVETLRTELFKNLKVLLDLANKHNLKVILLAGGGSLEEALPIRNNINKTLSNASLEYQQFLRFLAREFKDHPALFAIDLFNEPFTEKFLYTTNGTPVENIKNITSKMTRDWYAAIRSETKSSIIVTIGTINAGGSNTWDPISLSYDILSPHEYPLYEKGYTFKTFENTSYFYYQLASSTNNKRSVPYFWGEFGLHIASDQLPMNLMDYAPFGNDSQEWNQFTQLGWGDANLAGNFVKDARILSDSCMSQGEMIWEYQTQRVAQVTLNYLQQTLPGPSFGIVDKNKNLKNYFLSPLSHQPQTNQIKNCKLPSTYYRQNQSNPSFNNFTLISRVKDSLGNPIKNAVIETWRANDWNYKVSISNTTGNFSVTHETHQALRLIISAPGYEVKNVWLNSQNSAIAFLPDFVLNKQQLSYLSSPPNTPKRVNYCLQSNLTDSKSPIEKQ
jgi:hypothetical protein